MNCAWKKKRQIRAQKISSLVFWCLYIIRRNCICVRWLSRYWVRPMTILNCVWLTEVTESIVMSEMSAENTDGMISVLFIKNWKKTSVFQRIPMPVFLWQPGIILFCLIMMIFCIRPRYTEIIRWLKKNMQIYYIRMKIHSMRQLMMRLIRITNRIFHRTICVLWIIFAI